MSSLLMATPARKPLPSLPPYGPNAVEVKDLTFSYQQSNHSSGASTTTASAVNGSNQPSCWVLEDLNLRLERGSRCLLIGANGSGKSTLLRILAGRHLPKPVAVVAVEGPRSAPTTVVVQPTVHVLGLHAFHDTRLNFHRAYLDCDWGMRNVAFVGAAVPLMADIAVRNMMEKLQSEYPDRRDELLDLLMIDLDWRMHQLSDGQRRRVQIFLGLIRPFEILCLDEITTSLDVVVRQDLLRWLTKESEERGATILYATHIFDGLDDWATHLLYLTDKGRCGWQGPVNELPLYRQLSSDGKHPAKMLAVAEAWLRAEWDERKQKRRREKAMGAGALLEEMNVTDRSQGGYSSGRMRMDVVKQPEPCRPGRLSDVFGNRGVMDKVSRIANDDGV